MVTTQLQAIIDLIPEPRAVQDLIAAALTQEARIAELEAALLGLCRILEQGCIPDVQHRRARAVLAKGR